MPSAKVLESKKARVEELTDLIKGAAAGVIVDYKGISVADDTKLRKEPWRSMAYMPSRIFASAS